MPGLFPHDAAKVTIKFLKIELMSKKNINQSEKEWKDHCYKVLFDSSWNAKEWLDEVKEATIRLPIKVEYPSTTTRGKLFQAIRILAKRTTIRGTHSLLDIAERNSSILSSAMKWTKSYTKHPKVQLTTNTEHCILSEYAEEYSVSTYHQTQRLSLLKLQLSLCNDVLVIRIACQRSLWLSLFLERNCSCQIYRILYT